LLWYSTETGGNGSPVAPVPSSVNVSNTTFYVSATSGVCEGPRSPLTVIVNSTPAAPAVGGPVTYCQASVVPPLSATGSNLLWYDGPSGGTGSTSAPANYTSVVGNTTYYVSQTTGICEGPRASINVTINPYPNLGPNLQDTVCFGDSVNLSAKFNTTGFTIKWTLEGVEVATPEAVKATGVYQLEATNSVGCSDTVLVAVKIQPVVPAFAGNDTTAIKGAPHMLLGSGGASYTWTPAFPLNAMDAQYPLATLDHDQLFTVTVTDIAGCIGTDKVFVKVYDGPTYYVPNAFSPNGDGLNDIFRVVPVGIAYTDYFKIFNRFGQLVFESNEWMKGWDGSFRGKKQPIGNYVWVLKGMNKYGKVVEMKGTVLIIQ
ncbi:MAG: gliding motility-associated C-terminal domain-containing protein, partial [Ferruginibacter sp.]